MMINHVYSNNLFAHYRHEIRQMFHSIFSPQSAYDAVMDELIHLSRNNKQSMILKNSISANSICSVKLGNFSLAT